MGARGQNLFDINFKSTIEIKNLYNEFHIKQEALKLITPNFETPMLGLKPAVFPPILQDNQPPNLELFDLDEEFADSKIKLAQLTNRCTNENIEYYIQESSKILGMQEKTNINNSKAILTFILKEVCKFKMQNI